MCETGARPNNIWNNLILNNCLSVFTGLSNTVHTDNFYNGFILADHGIHEN